MKKTVDKKAYDKFNRRDNGSAAKALFPQLHRKVFYVEYIQPQHTNPTGEKHGPVGKPAPEYFQQPIAEGADRIYN